MIAPFQKTVAEVRTLVLDFGPKLATGEVLQGVPSAMVDDPGLTISHMTLTESTVVLKVGGGVPGTTYLVAAHANTTGGNELEVHRYVEVVA